MSLFRLYIEGMLQARCVKGASLLGCHLEHSRLLTPSVLVRFLLKRKIEHETSSDVLGAVAAPALVARHSLGVNFVC